MLFAERLTVRYPKRSLMAEYGRGFAQALGTWPCLGADAGAVLRASQRRQAVIPGNFHTLLTFLALFYPSVFSFKSSKNNIPINGILCLINGAKLYCLCSVENSVRAFKCFVQGEKEKGNPKLRNLCTQISYLLGTSSSEYFKKFLKSFIEIFPTTICRQM